MENTLNLVIAKLNEIKAEHFDTALNKWNEIYNAVDFSSADLKVHHASYYLYGMVEGGILSLEECNQLFQHACECELDSFTDWENENIPSIQRQYIGRTSSFYYMPKKWYGEHICDGTIEDLLRNKDIDLKEIFGDLATDMYNFLFGDKSINYYASEFIETIHNLLEEGHDMDDFKTELDELFEDSIDVLEGINSELEDLEEIVIECQKAYEYLEEYKKKENEIETFKYFLEYDIENIISENLAEEVVNELMQKMTPLNKLENIIIDYTTDGTLLKFKVVTNINTWTYLTRVKNTNEYAKLLADCTLFVLKEKLQKMFDFEVQEANKK